MLAFALSRHLAATVLNHLAVCNFLQCARCGCELPCPSEMNFGMTAELRSFRNLTLSHRGSERQPPNALQVALRFSRLMELAEASGKHAPSMTTEERLRSCIADWHDSPGLLSKHKLDEDKIKSVANIVIGTCAVLWLMFFRLSTCWAPFHIVVPCSSDFHIVAPCSSDFTSSAVSDLRSEESREILRSHLDHAKWKESAVNTEQLRSQRWMIGTAPKASACPPDLRKVLTVTEQSQTMHLQLLVHTYVEAGRRLRASARPRMRLSVEKFEAMADYACMISAVLTEAKALSSWSAEKEAAVMKAFYQQYHGLFHAFFN